MLELQRKPHEVGGYSIADASHDKSRSVLVLECNALKLDPSLSATANQLSHLISSGLHADVISVNSEFGYQTQLSERRAAQAQYSLIVVLGDGNASRLILAEERVLSWAEFTYQTLLPFEPEYLLLLSDSDDREIPAHTFFETVPMLKEVYTSSATDIKLRSDILKFMVSYLVKPAPSDYDRAFSRQIADRLLGSGVLRRWTWRDSLKQRVLNTFDLLSDSEKLEIAAELIRRTAQNTSSRFATPYPATDSLSARLSNLPDRLYNSAR
jgi:hypothetical protein